MAAEKSSRANRGCETDDHRTHGRKAVAVDAEIRDPNPTRLRPIAGHPRELQRIAAEDRYRADILVPIASVHEELGWVGRGPMRGHLERRATAAITRRDAEADATHDELLDPISKHAR